MNRIALIAIGGNSLIKDKHHQTVEDQYDAAVETCEHIVDLMEEGWEVVVTHGNGPQVGFVLLRSELSRKQLHEIPLEVCGADTQGAIGYMLQQILQNLLHGRGIQKMVVTVVTQTVVDAEDPSFRKPSKPIGPFYQEEDALTFASERGWTVAEDSGRGWRRLVASPRPMRIVEMEAISKLIECGIGVVALGGGGIPVVEKDGNLQGVSAVIAKDGASSLLAHNIRASTFIISTTVDKVSLNFGTPEETPIDEMTVAQAKQYIADGHFKPGSMLPKIQAALSFLENGGEQVIITCPGCLLEAVHGETGTRIVH